MSPVHQPNLSLATRLSRVKARRQVLLNGISLFNERTKGIREDDKKIGIPDVAMKDDREPYAPYDDPSFTPLQKHPLSDNFLKSLESELVVIEKRFEEFRTFGLFVEMVLDGLASKNFSTLIRAVEYGRSVGVITFDGPATKDRVKEALVTLGWVANAVILLMPAKKPDTVGLSRARLTKRYDRLKTKHQCLVNRINVFNERCSNMTVDARILAQPLANEPVADYPRFDISAFTPFDPKSLSKEPLDLYEDEIVEAENKFEGHRNYGLFVERMMDGFAAEGFDALIRAFEFGRSAGVLEFEGEVTRELVLRALGDMEKMFGDYPNGFMKVKGKFANL
ncbi:hypothetical protein BJ508DRAFT_340968 [Ascobolus immersus RN42]|uniref:Uncharacterized protein n=1 Tax=Ascobolus immersus RN42 TaxID=1160509 RepID=A0A3N4HMG2_ASCIM|nr:hypothetical protein BJ508DRAFT_340968 [Ascobolus immersus RN42]